MRGGIYEWLRLKVIPFWRPITPGTYGETRSKVKSIRKYAKSTGEWENNPTRTAKERHREPTPFLEVTKNEVRGLVLHPVGICLATAPVIHAVPHWDRWSSARPIGWYNVVFISPGRLKSLSQATRKRFNWTGFNIQPQRKR